MKSTDQGGLSRTDSFTIFIRNVNEKPIGVKVFKCLSFFGHDGNYSRVRVMLSTFPVGYSGASHSLWNDFIPCSQLSPGQVAENSNQGTFVGSLSTSDPDAGQSFTYRMLTNAGGRFMLVGSTVKVGKSLIYFCLLNVYFRRFWNIDSWWPVHFSCVFLLCVICTLLTPCLSRLLNPTLVVWLKVAVPAHSTTKLPQTRSL